MGGPIRKKGMVDMQNILAQFCMNQLGFGPVGEIRIIHGGSGNAYNYFRDKFDEANMHTYVSQGESALVTQRNDVLLVTPASHAWRGDADATATALTWDKESTHMLGMDPGGLGGYQRARFGHSGYTMANFMTVSGANNKFKNLRWMHGSSTGGASDTTCITVSGAGNIFDSCCFGGPMDATQASSANYIGVAVSGTQNHFKNCLFGTSNAIQRSGANCMLKFTAGGALNIFENCIFRSNSLTATDCFFINWASTESSTPNGIFLNCQFINHKAAASSNMVAAITSTSHANNTLFFDNRCTFSGVDDIIAEASEAKIVVGGNTYTAAATSNLLAKTSDYN